MADEHLDLIELTDIRHGAGLPSTRLGARKYAQKNRENDATHDKLALTETGFQAVRLFTKSAAASFLRHHSHWHRLALIPGR